MSQTIAIEPVTRIEGHARITLELDDAGKIEDAKFHLTQFRGFEKFCEGRPYREMPALTARTCGICPVSHLLASSKACDALLCVRIPEVAMELRRLMNLAQITQSHALSFFHLSSPDLLLGWDCDPAERNVFGVMFRHPQLAREGIRLRQIGQTIIEMLGGKKVHPTWVVPGGVSEPLSEEKRDIMLGLVDEGLDIAKRTYEFYKDEVVPKFKDEAKHFGNFPSMFLSLVSPKGHLEHYDGFLRIKDANGLFRWYNDYRIPEHLGEGQITVRLHQDDDDRARKFNRTENVRPIPPSDPDFPRLYGRRNDSESLNRSLEDTLFLGRAHSLGAARQQVEMLGWALMVNALTLARHRAAEDIPAAA